MSDTESARIAEYGRGEPEVEPPFPPPMIVRWVRRESVSLEVLLDEMRYWIRRMESAAETERPGPVLEGRDIFDWAEMADELAEALAHPEIADRVLAKYESWRPARKKVVQTDD